MEEEKKIVEEVQTQPENTADFKGESLNDRVKVLSPGMMVAKRFFRSKLSMIGLITLIALFLICFIGPLFSPWQSGGKPVPDLNNVKDIVTSQKIVYETPYGDMEGFIISEITPLKNERGDITWQHWLGTNELGEDIFTNLMLGGRISLTVGFLVIILETVIGVILGGLAGYFGGWVDNLIMRIVDILSCIPSLPIMLILSSVFTPENGIAPEMKLYCMMGVLTLFGWVGTARLVRGQILSLREQEFMLAAKCSGLSTYRQIFKHLLPNIMPQLIVSMTMGLGSVILTEATLGFLGLGAPLDTPTWGSMISTASKMEYLSGYPNFWVPPGICITLAILAFNFVGDGLRDAFDPKMKR